MERCVKAVTESALSVYRRIHSCQNSCSKDNACLKQKAIILLGTVIVCLILRVFKVMPITGRHIVIGFILVFPHSIIHKGLSLAEPDFL